MYIFIFKYFTFVKHFLILSTSTVRLKYGDFYGVSSISYSKFSLFLYKFISIFLQLSGLGILIAGIVVLNDVTDFNHFLEGRITAPPILLIIAGLCIFLIAFFGCYGALKESPKLLMAVFKRILFYLTLCLKVLFCMSYSLHFFLE